MLLLEPQLASRVDDTQRAADAARVGGDVDASVDRVELDRDELAHLVRARGRARVGVGVGVGVRVGVELDRDELAHVAGAAQLAHRGE